MEDQLWARAAVGGDGALSEQEECRGQASRLSPHNGRNGCCDLCLSWLKVPVDSGGGVQPGSIFFILFFQLDRLEDRCSSALICFPQRRPGWVLLQH